jgi:glutamate-1-semialdehyde 2,1-aminomutase/spore coat polysaccharide biosynthesis protein SpsF
MTTTPTAASWRHHNLRSYARSEALLKRALDVIPLGTQTFSKSYQQFVRNAMPQMLVSGDGCRVVDADGQSYIDYLLGLLPIVLGYRDPDVDAAIRTQLDSGITFSLPTPLEADLAERLVRLIPCADMVRFGKNGSDATSAAIRLARAHTRRDGVIVCGYHGWHDWYIATTSRHLGIPDAVRKLTTSFPFNRPDALEDLLKANPDGYAAVIMEPVGAEEPAPGFLAEVRRLTEKYGVVLVFDEIIAGFRIHLGGAQAEYGVTPDLACFGKSMANGMPISAIVGRRDIMMLMNDIFFSGTFGGEALSLAAAIATLDKLEREDVVARLRRRGRSLAARVNALAGRHGLTDLLRVGGADWWPRWKYGKLPLDSNLFQSLLRQEAAQNGLILLATFNLCLAHDSDAIEEETAAALDATFAALRAALDSGDPASHLRGEAIRPTFSVRPA